MKNEYIYIKNTLFGEIYITRQRPQTFQRLGNNSSIRKNIYTYNTNTTPIQPRYIDEDKGYTGITHIYIEV